ncbi:5-oxoprolinase subunit PxpB [Sinirhodobacter populi]|uniref:5-oxoprolinase subunit PxpB n=1 Tax=Paenirhodobacter populi TaxID=2306993 RepID=A0A443K6Q2_9RHOB|nr:5-oxoprolinase subunit PxpB [Sinirhodobacter populi]RWR28353.1 5-oxoprolinase subunit PxpB [Sinirhodobacter populi]
MAPTPSILPAGDSAFLFQIGEEISAPVNERIVALADALEAGAIPGLREVVPTYRSLLVCYDPERVRGAALARRVRAVYDRLGPVRAAARRLTVPCLYGGEVGQDLAELAKMKGLTTDEVIALHSGVEYRVYMIGFAPGFAYLGGLPEKLHTPRLAKPRQHIPAGAIGIGGQQASVNSVAGPSGWRFIGWTPVHAFDPGAKDPFLFRAGDRIRFRPIDPSEAEDLRARQAAGEAIVGIAAPDTEAGPADDRARR